jgi:hypothetical protein
MMQFEDCRYSSTFLSADRLSSDRSQILYSIIKDSSTERFYKSKGHPITGHEGPTGGVEV